MLRVVTRTRLYAALCVHYLSCYNLMMEGADSSETVVPVCQTAPRRFGRA